MLDIKLFNIITLLSGRNSIIDKCMIFFSNNIRYVYVILLFFLWFKNTAYKRMTAKVIISCVITLLINLLIRMFYFKPRPFQQGNVEILIPSKMDSSFPSKHTLLVFAISTIVFFYQRILGVILLAMALLTGFSRVWVGHHYPSDILGSSIIGAFISIFIQKSFRLQR